MRNLRVIHLADQYEAALSDNPLCTTNRVASELRERVCLNVLTRDEAVEVIVRSTNLSEVCAADVLGLYR